MFPLIHGHIPMLQNVAQHWKKCLIRSSECVHGVQKKLVQLLPRPTITSSPGIQLPPPQASPVVYSLPEGFAPTMTSSPGPPLPPPQAHHYLFPRPTIISSPGPHLSCTAFLKASYPTMTSIIEGSMAMVSLYTSGSSPTRELSSSLTLCP